jgi:hypothetical protein
MESAGAHGEPVRHIPVVQIALQNSKGLGMHRLDRITGRRFRLYLLFGTESGLIGTVFTIAGGTGLYPFVPAARPGMLRHSIE